MYSLLQSRVLRFRVLNLAACAILVVFNGLIEVWPMVAMNLVLCAINLWFIMRLVRERHDAAAYEVLEVQPDDEYLRHVLRVHGGTTVEVSNTDAEGRLVLADALAYADAELEPDVLIDVATLTGAASMGLGPLHGALYSADPELVRVLEAAGRATGEPVWHMPLVEDYASALDSSVADVSHVPLVNHGGGSITAALFLRSFVGERRWAHLDIAGPARSTKDGDEVVAGATGYGARLLLAALRELA